MVSILYFRYRNIVEPQLSFAGQRWIWIGFGFGTIFLFSVKLFKKPLGLTLEKQEDRES